MIGTVRNAEAVIPITVFGPRGSKSRLRAVVDTGFNAELTLPPYLIRQLGLRYLTDEPCLLADGSEVQFSVYEGFVDWDGVKRRIVVEEADTDPLVGMELLNGFRLTMDVRKGGKVTIKKLK